MGVIYLNWKLNIIMFGARSLGWLFIYFAILLLIFGMLDAKFKKEPGDGAGFYPGVMAVQ